MAFLNTSTRSMYSDWVLGNATLEYWFSFRLIVIPNNIKTMNFLIKICIQTQKTSMFLLIIIISIFVFETKSNKYFLIPIFSTYTTSTYPSKSFFLWSYFMYFKPSFNKLFKYLNTHFKNSQWTRSIISINRLTMIIAYDEFNLL